MSIKVKALEWTQYPDGGLQAIGAKMERFRVRPSGRSWYLGQDYMGEGGKDAAQAWFNAAILSVLEPSPDMREAVEALEKFVWAADEASGAGLMDAIDNSGKPYQSQWLADLLDRARTIIAEQRQ